MKASIKLSDLLAITSGGKIDKLDKAARAGAALAVEQGGRLYRVTTDADEVITGLAEGPEVEVELEAWRADGEGTAAAATPARRGRGRQPAGVAPSAPTAQRVGLTLTTTELGKRLAAEQGISLSALVDQLIHGASSGEK